jgi:SAM-dependent methyltransferase
MGCLLSGPCVDVTGALEVEPMTHYVHGYGASETVRLQHQADALAGLLHDDLTFADGSRILEAGSGTGAQTVQLLRRHPGVAITCVEREATSLAAAARRLRGEPGGDRAELVQADLESLPFPHGAFDHLFVCFVLEHLADPAAVLRKMLAVVKPGGSVTVIEGDHGTACFHPEDASARAAIECLVRLQRAAGGDALIGRRLFPLLKAAGVQDVRVEPRMVYVDGNRPDLADAFTLHTFTSMVAAVRSAAVARQVCTPEVFDAGVAALERSAQADGVFLYTFFRARGSVHAGGLTQA